MTCHAAHQGERVVVADVVVAAVVGEVVAAAAGRGNKTHCR